MVFLGLTVIVGGETAASLYSMTAWTLLAGAYVAVALWGAWRQRVVPDAEVSPEPVLPLRPWMVSLLGLAPVVAAFMGLLAGLDGLLAESMIDHLSQILQVDEETTLSIIRTAFNAVTVLMAVLGWFLLHLSYARHYERLDSLHGPAFSFPEAKDPVSTDYVYFAMMIGTSFAVSGVTVTSRRLRWTVTIHSVLAFFYNAIVMAIAFKIITS